MNSARLTKAALIVSLLTRLCPSAFALNPSLDISQYAHTAWTIREGFFKGMIYSIAQTPDGYLWLGTEFGLVRFDGVRPSPWTPPGAARLPSSQITKLYAARDGTLWIGTSAGLVSWDGAKLTQYPEVSARVWSILQDREGTVWAGGTQAGTGFLCRVQGGASQCYGQDGSLGYGVQSLYEDGTGNLWAGAGSGLWLWKPGVPTHYAMPEPEITDLTQSEIGKLLVAMRRQISEYKGGKTTPWQIPGAPKFPITRMLRDRDGALWIGTHGQGLLHVRQGRTDVFSRADGLSADEVLSVFEDREGNIWVTTYAGLDRFREFPVAIVSARQGLSGDSIYSVLGARDASVWLATPHGLDRWRKGQVTTFKKSDGLPDDGAQSLSADDEGRLWAYSAHGLAFFFSGRFVQVAGVPGGSASSIAGDNAGNLWLSQGKALLHLQNGKLAEQIPWSRLGHSGKAWALAADSGGGGLWLGFQDGGVARFNDGQVRASYARADGLGAGFVADLQIHPDGAIWAATEGGLSVIREGRIATLSSKNGLPCDTVYWSIQDGDHSTWLYMPCGLVRLAHSEVHAWAKDPKRRIATSVFDGSDGFTPRALPGGLSPRVAKDTDGKIWFVTFDGVSVFDPRHLPVNKIPPPVHIGQVIADDKPCDLKPGMRLPPNVHTLRIEYTALSLVAPEKVHFKYKLEGQNRNWHEVINERQATYTNLAPRKYRFRVIASNNSGVWNETGDTLEFSIAPAYYQSNWFYASCVAAFLAMLWGLYRLRLYQIRREFNAQLDGSVEERMRVARELHDTLLQSFQASLIQMQAARNIFARRPEKAEQSLDKAITMAAGAVAEGRNAIQDLRVHPAGGGDLAQLLTAAGQELARSGEVQGNPPFFRVTVEGERQDLEPLLQDEVYRIARELLRNAFRHAQAGRIEAEIRYESRQLRVHIRDDGKGIDPEILKAGGSAGHWGMPGMRERADRFGGKLDFWSEAGAGTEAVLTVPVAVAYGAANGGRFSFLRRRKTGA